jgi:hypothetical protein
LICQYRDQFFYRSGFDKEKTTLDELLEYYMDHEPAVINIQMRNYLDRKDKSKHFKVTVHKTSEAGAAEQIMLRIPNFGSDKSKRYGSSPNHKICLSLSGNSFKMLSHLKNHLYVKTILISIICFSVSGISVHDIQRLGEL